MTKADKELLLNFVTRIGMYVHPMEASSVINFIYGYEAGTRNKCDFTEQLKQLLSSKYKVDYSSDGWPGQVGRLAKRRHLSWLIIFRRITLEIIANAEGSNLNDSQREYIKNCVSARLIDRIEATGHPWFGAAWVEEWQSLCIIRSSWFRQLWSRKEWAAIRAIDTLVQTGGLFRDDEPHLPSLALMQLKETYNKVIGESK